MGAFTVVVPFCQACDVLRWASGLSLIHMLYYKCMLDHDGVGWVVRLPCWTSLSETPFFMFIDFCLMADGGIFTGVGYYMALRSYGHANKSRGGGGRERVSTYY